jgi:hypothetical protein
MTMFASTARLRKPHAVYFLVGGHGGDPLQKLARHHNALVTEREHSGRPQRRWRGRRADGRMVDAVPTAARRPAFKPA